MRFREILQQPIYTLITLGIMGVVYELSVAIFRPLFVDNEEWVPIVYGALGILLLLFFTDVRKIVRKGARHLLLGATVPPDRIDVELVTIFARELDKQRIGEVTARLIKESFGFRHVHIFLRSEDKEFVAIRPEHGTDDYSTLRDFLLTNDNRTRTWTRSELYRFPELRTYCEIRNIYLIVPLYIDRVLIGWIEGCHGARWLLSDSVHICNRIQPLLSVTFHRVMLDVKFALRIEQLVALNRISQTMNSSLNVKETLESVMDNVIDLLHVDRALMYLVSDDGKRCVPRIGRGIGEGVRLDFSIDIEQSIFAHIMKYRQPLIVEDAENDARVNKTYAQLVKTQSFVIVPMVSKEKVIGVIGVDNLYSRRPVSGINIELLVTLANDAAIALTNSRLYEEVQTFNQRLQERIDEATQHLRALLEMKSHFLSVASHQLRTPTTVIKGMLSMVEEDPDLSPQKMREFVHHAYLSSGRLERIVNELLSATELEDPQVRVNIEEVDIVEMVRGIVSHLEPLARQRNDVLSFHTTHEKMLLRTDKYKLSEALANLVDNALRYTKDGAVTVSVSQVNEQVAIAIKDTGLGITSEEKEIIFDKFRRGAESIDMDPNGTGLGLYIVKRTLDVLRGSIAIESEGRGKGSVFSVFLQNSERE